MRRSCTHGGAAGRLVHSLSPVGVHALQKSRAAVKRPKEPTEADSGRAVMRRVLPLAGDRDGRLPVDPEELLYALAGEQGALSLNLMEHSSFKTIVKDFVADGTDAGIMLRVVADSDLSIGASVMDLCCAKDVGLDMRHFLSTCKNRLDRMWRKGGT